MKKAINQSGYAKPLSSTEYAEQQQNISAVFSQKLTTTIVIQYFRDNRGFMFFTIAQNHDCQFFL